VSLIDATTGVVVTAVVDLVEAATVVDLVEEATTGVAVVVFLVETLFFAGVAGIVAEAVVLSDVFVILYDVYTLIF
jgi:hypothetical protein